DVEHPPRRLTWAEHAFGEQDCARAGPEKRPAARNEPARGGFDARAVEQAEHRGRFAAGNDEHIEPVDLGCGAHLDRTGKRRDMGGKIALQREYAGPTLHETRSFAALEDAKLAMLAGHITTPAPATSLRA